MAKDLQEYIAARLALSIEGFRSRSSLLGPQWARTLTCEGDC